MGTLALSSRVYFSSWLALWDHYDLLRKSMKTRPWRIAGICLGILAIVSTVYLYTYPIVKGCRFKTNEESLRLLVLADPQLEGDTSIDRRNGDQWFPSLQRTSLTSLWTGASTDLPLLLRRWRKEADLWGNDHYLAHIHWCMRHYTRPSHTVVLGDLLGSQWISNEEFDRRARRYWQRVFRGRTAADLINVAGNHDIGYGGDMDRANIDRFESAFGKVNWDTRLTLSHGQVRLIVLNSLNLDTPVLYPEAQQESYNFINSVIADSNHSFNVATILLTHVPLHKPTHVCVDPPGMQFYDDDIGGTIKEQNHLSPYASEILLQGLFGGPSSPGIILTGHDHEGCDVIHYRVGDKQWGSGAWNGTTGEQVWVREVTQRSMMGDFGGYAGLLSVEYDDSLQKWNFQYQACSLGTQHIWWAIHVLDIVTVIFLALLGVRTLARGQSKQKTA